MKHVILGLVLLVLVGGIVLLAVGSWAVSVNNGLARSEQNVNEKWAQVQTVYQRRLDLIPGLEESVKGFARQERTVLTEVTQARSRASGVQLTPEALNDPKAMERFAAAQAQVSGAPSQRVNDYAGLLPADARGRLESTLAQRESATGAQMVIAIFPSLEGESLEDFGIRLAERWRVGQKSLDNGVILLVFVKERRVRMEVGYGLEPVLTDAVASQIVRETIAPRFREQRYAAGLQGAVDAVFARVDTKALSPARRSPGRGVSPWTLAVLGVFGVVVVMLAIDAMSGGRARRNAY